MSTTTTAPAPAGPEDGGSYWTSARTTAAGLVLATIAGLGVWIGHHHDNHTTPVAGAAYDSACGLKGGTTQMPTVTPPTKWQTFAGMPWATSAAYGPGRRVADGPWSCFARTPTGAVLAAWTIPSRVAVAKDLAAVVKQQTLPGPGQQVLLKKGHDGSAYGSVTLLGFRIDGYTNDAAQVSFHVQQDGADLACASDVEWIGGANGDWLLALQPDGSTIRGCTPDFDAGDFVAWGPTS